MNVSGMTSLSGISYFQNHFQLSQRFFMVMGRILLILCLLIYSSFASNAQTCCSGGVPVSSNLGFQSSDEKSIHVSISADLNFLRTLKTESSVLDDDQRLRTTQSYLLRGAYSLSDRLTVEGLFPIVRQTRRITSVSGSNDREATFGVGDPVALLIYDVLKKGVTFRLGAGPQIPLGGTEQTNDRGLRLLEDLQPGSGAWDVIVLASLEHNLKSRPSSLIYINSILSFTGVNNNARGGAQTYEFGNDIQIITGFSDQILVFNNIITPGLSFRYRHADRDLISGSELPGTGGNFLFTRLSNAIPFPKANSSLNINLELPIWSRVNDTQLSPTYTINIGWSKKFIIDTQPDQLIQLN